MRFHSAPVVRLADGKPMQLGHAARADGAWRLYAFADASGQRLRALADFLAESASSPVRRFTPAGADIDSVIDFRAVYQQGHRELEVDALPAMLLPRKGRFGLVDYEKVYCARPQASVRTSSTCAASIVKTARWSSFGRISTFPTCFHWTRTTASPPSSRDFFWIEKAGHGTARMASRGRTRHVP